MLISLLFPSRKRAHRAAEMCRSVEKTTIRLSCIEVLIQTDLDDESYASILGTIKMNVGLFVAPRQQFLSSCYNTLYAASCGDIIGYLADDCIFETDGWDEIVREHFRNYPVSLLSDSKNPEDVNNNPMHAFVSRRSADALGYLLRGCYEHGYADRDIHAVYKAASAPVIFSDKYGIAHRHWHSEPALLDETYKIRSLEKDSEGRTCDDRDALTFAAKAGERQRDAEKLRALLGITPPCP